ncbi:MAG: recombinase family protein [Opitutaceae bacterium]|jgi:DNA invertase Pin-like site-specific DNA recombinase
MTAQVTLSHRQKAAYVYVRQSTMGQVRNHQESTERQYALKDKAISLGWPATGMQILDGDLGISGATSSGRDDFKRLVAEVSLGEVGAVFALEASRLARSNADWHRLIEICALTGTLIIDEDGCYDPADFNDGLLLGMKAQMSQAELHFLRARLQGGKLNKAKKGQLRFPLPVGLCYDDAGAIVLDPDAEVRGAVELLLALFRETGSGYAVAQTFAARGLKFPKRAYGGVWNGRLIWGHLTDDRVRSVVKNPAYAGVYAFGRYRCVKYVLANGEVRSRVKAMPRPSWLVEIQNHHPGYISFDEHLHNLDILQRNRTNGEDTLLSGPAREGLAILQGLLVCRLCGRHLTPRYQGNGGIYPVYECNWRKRQGRSSKSCISIPSGLVDQAIANRMVQVVSSDQIHLALDVLQELEKRDDALQGQWRMRLERADYEAQLAQRRYEHVDPANRLVAASLEQRWNEALCRLEEIRQEFGDFQRSHGLAVTAEQRTKILALAKDFPRLWNAPTTLAKDKKRMLRLLVKDITVERITEPRQVLLHVRWQGGACEDIAVDLPLPIADRLRYSEELVEQVRRLATEKADAEIADALNQQGCRSAKGKPFTQSMIAWIRYKHRIPSPELKRPEELTVTQVAEKFDVSPNVVYYWIQRGILVARRRNGGSALWVTLDPETERRLWQWAEESTRIQKSRSRQSQRSL